MKNKLKYFLILKGPDQFLNLLDLDTLTTESQEACVAFIRSHDRFDSKDKFRVGTLAESYQRR